MAGVSHLLWKHCITCRIVASLPLHDSRHYINERLVLPNVCVNPVDDVGSHFHFIGFLFPMLPRSVTRLSPPEYDLLGLDLFPLCFEALVL